MPFLGVYNALRKESAKMTLCHHKLLLFVWKSWSENFVKHKIKWNVVSPLKLWPQQFSVYFCANDSLLFCHTNLESCRRLGSLLNDFCQNSRQLINFHKLSLSFSKNATSHDLHITSSVFNITHHDNLGKYLGCPMFEGRSLVETYSKLVNSWAVKLRRPITSPKYRDWP